VTLFTAHSNHRRTIRDLAGTLWQVAEHDAGDVPGAMGPRCLIFDSQSIVRRFWRYPGDWHALADDNLLAFMNQSRLISC
jgi:D-serine deaminase-like pyridoxal phosphate-dependent protein